MNLRPSGYEPNIFGGFLPTNRGGGQMVDNPDKPKSWWKLGGQLVDNFHLCKACKKPKMLKPLSCKFE